MTCRNTDMQETIQKQIKTIDVPNNNKLVQLIKSISND